MTEEQPGVMAAPEKNMRQRVQQVRCSSVVNDDHHAEEKGNRGEIYRVQGFLTAQNSECDHENTAQQSGCGAVKFAR